MLIISTDKTTNRLFQLFKHVTYIFIAMFLTSSTLFADASNTPDVTISPSSQDIIAGTPSVTLTISLSPAPNKDAITINYSDSCNSSTGSIVFAVGDSSSSITIPTASLVGGDTCNVTITSATGGPSQDDGDISSATALIVVPSNNLPPTAHAGPDQSVLFGGTVTFDGSSSTDSDGSIVSYKWAENETTLSTSASFSKSDFSVGTHIINLTVTDDDGDSNSDTLVLTVSDADIPPVMNNIPDKEAVNGNTFSLNLSDYVSLTNDDPITSYTLSGSLPLGITFNSSTGVFSGIPTVNGTYSFTVYATDNDGNSNSESFNIIVGTSITPPSFENTSSCGLFNSVLTSHTHIYSNGTNDQACYTNNISYPEGELTGSIECNIGGCGGGTVCQRQDPPLDRLTPSFPTNNKSGAPNGSNPTTLVDLEYGDLTYNSATINFNPATSYSDNVTKLMLLGDVVISKSTLNFEPGDYYFDSLTVDGNNNNVVLPSGGPVRIFIKNDFLIDMNNLHFNTGGNENDVFVYVGGNYESIGNGGGTTSWKAFMYVKGSTTLTNSSNNWTINGAITSEGPIEINGNNPDFIQSGSASDLGYGGCPSVTPVTGVFDAWESSISNRQITTKIVNNPFTLTIASLNNTMDAVETKSGITAQYQLYDYNTDTSITNFENFDASTSSTVIKTYTVTPSAYKDVRVRFKYCQDSSNNIVAYSNCEYPITPGCTFVENVASTDDFAIRPDSFILTAPSGENINLLKSAKDYTFPLTAVQYGTTTPTTDYTIPSADSVLSLVRTMYLPTNTIDATLNGTLAFSTTSFNVTNGSANALINFDDVGKVNIQLRDTVWAAVDSDDTSGDCTASGRYVCGDINATFIPDHFTLSAVHLNNSNAGTFTYLSNDLNESAHLDVTVTAKNLNDVTTQNFNSGSWENPVDINISVSAAATTPSINKNEIDGTQNLGFITGAISIPWNETNSSKQLMFNFNREVNTEKNPFIINGSEVTLGAASTYTDGGDSVTVTGSNVADQNATFLYGRTHATRQRFSGDTNQPAFIYYEAYCSGTDNNGNVCNKSLLPNGSASLNTDNPRWFRNTLHTSSSGVAGTVTQKGGGTSVTATPPTTATPSQTNLTYVNSASKGYPYKTTMQNAASSWLIYNKYNSSATANEFDVEFEGSGEWVGTHETNTTTIKTGTERTNRRTMW